MTKRIENIYLLSANLNVDGGIVEGSARPIHDRFITLEDQSILVKAMTPENKEAPAVKESTKASRQVYRTDSHGVLCSFDSAKHVASEADALKQGFTFGAATVITDVKTRVYIPPLHLVKYSFAAYGYEKWIAEFHAGINSIIDNNDNSVSEMTLQAVNIKTAFSTDDYQQWQKHHDAGDTVRALVMARSRAIVITFSADGYKDAKVTIKNRKGEAVFFGHLGALDNKTDDEKKTSREASVGVYVSYDSKGNKEKTIYSATFFDLTNQYNPSAEVRDQMYQITVVASRKSLELSPGLEGSDELSYTLVERLRFPIQTFAGDFDVINGDAISLEESLLRQFPQRYPNVLKGLQGTQSEDKPMPGELSLAHAMNTHVGKIKLAAEAISADSQFAFMKTLGLGLLGSIDSEDSRFLRTRDSINLAFNAFDTSNKIEEAMKAYTDFHAANSHLRAIGVPGAGEIARFAERVNSLYPRGSEASPIAFPASLSNSFKKLQSVAGKVAKGADIYNAFNDIGGAYVGIKELEKAVNNTTVVYKDYAHKVFVEDINIEQNGDAQVKAQPSAEDVQSEFKQLADFQKNNKKTAHFTRVGDAYFINVTFVFDRADFIPDETLQDLVALLKSVKGDYQITLIGHTDNKGSEKYNENLSVRRALSVGQELAKSGIGRDQAVNVKIEGRGKSEPVVNNNSDDNRRKNRRVEAIIILHTSAQYKPSREGMVSLEKYRAMSTIQQAGIDEKVAKALLTTMDLVAGLPPLNPVHAAFSLAWTVARAGESLLSDGFDLLQKSIYGDAFLEVLKTFKNNDDLSRANQTMLMTGLTQGKVISPEYYLESQMRLRAEALAGLMQLLLRCSIETADFSDRNKFDFDNIMDGRTSFTYEDNLKHYRVMEYVERYLLKDGWVIPNAGFSTLALDEYWLFLIKTNLLEESVDSGESGWAWEEVADEVREAAKTASSLLDLVKDEVIDVKSNLIATSQFVYENARTLMTAEKEYLFKANFQKYFPIHFSLEGSLVEFCKNAIPDFASLDSDIYKGVTYSVREGGTNGDGGWVSMPDWLKGKRRWVSPLDEIRVCILLDHTKLDKYITDGTITRIPYSVWPVRLDILDMTGPSMDGFITKLDAAKLTEYELAVFKEDDDKSEKEIPVDLEALKDKVYGAIVYPIFKFGENIHRGTKPMADQYSAWLNVNAEHELRSLYNLDRVWEMTYGYQVKLGYNSATLRSIAYERIVHTARGTQLDKFEDFPYAICSSDNKEIPYGGEESFLDRHFLQVGSGTENYPPLFKNPQAFCFMNPDSKKSSNYHFPDKNWHGKKDGVAKTMSSNKSLHMPSFKWDAPVDLLILVVSDSIDIEAYDQRKRKKDIRSVPARIQLMRKGMNIDENGVVIGRGEGLERSIESEGPEYSASLTPFGHIVKDDDVGLRFEFDLNSSSSGAYDDLEEQLNNPLVLARLSGMSADIEVEEDKWELPEFLEKIKNELFSEVDKKPVYITQARLRYQNIVGGSKRGIKPFAAEASNSNKNWNWNLFVNVSSQGASGLSNTTASGIFNLPYPVELKDKKSHWYKISEKDRAAAIEKIEMNKETEKKYKDEVVDKRSVTHPESPAMIWLAKETVKDDLSGEQKKLVDNWLLNEGKRVTLSSMDLKAFK